MQIKPHVQKPYFHAVCATAIILAFAVSARSVLAVDGDLDSTFGTDGKVLSDFDHSTDIANGVAIQTDGKLVVVGTTYQDNDFSTQDFAITRYNPDGTLDKTFGAGGKVQTNFPGLAAVASSVAIQPDGKIVVAGGAFPLFTFLGNFELVRYNSDGSLDSSFGNGGIVTTNFPQGSYAFDVALQTDGKIIAARTIFAALILASVPIPILRWRVTTRMGLRMPPLATAARSQPIFSVWRTMPFRY